MIFLILSKHVLHVFKSKKFVIIETLEGKNNTNVLNMSQEINFINYQFSTNYFNCTRYNNVFIEFCELGELQN